MIISSSDIRTINSLMRPSHPVVIVAYNIYDDHEHYPLVSDLIMGDVNYDPMALTSCDAMVVYCKSDDSRDTLQEIFDELRVDWMYPNV
jgi:hypothetical protein